MYNLLKKLFPLCRSITGNGVRETLRIIQQHIPIQIHEVPSGKKCFDWTIPEEWNINDAYILTPDGAKIANFHENNLHVLNYSIPIKTTLNFDELRSHLFTIPSKPELIPYKTSYYIRNWGFCIPHNQLNTLKNGKYYVHIDSSLKKGSLTYADLLVKGKTKKEIFFSCYICHPSMANDSLSGVVLNVDLAKYLISRKNNYYSYRFIFVPETIGAIAYLKNNLNTFVKNAFCGLVLTCLGDSGRFTYKKTRLGYHQLDRVCINVLKHSNKNYEIREFWLPGSDERQYSSPGFNIPTASILRSVYGEFYEYHTSADNLDFVSQKNLEETFEIYKNVIEYLEEDHYYINKKPFGEIHLVKYNLDQNPFAEISQEQYIKEILTCLNYSDGKHSLSQIAEILNIPSTRLVNLINIIKSKKILKRKND